MLFKEFPLIHNCSFIQLEMVNQLSMLYTIHGMNKQLKPYLLIGHLDVVPVEQQNWEVDPFEGQIKDEFIYGRGTLDAKHIVMVIIYS